MQEVTAAKRARVRSFLSLPAHVIGLIPMVQRRRLRAA